MKMGPEGCILQGPIGLKLEKVHKVSLEGDCLQAHVPAFRTRPNTKGICKVTENPSLSPEKNQRQIDNIFGQYVSFDTRNTRSLHESRHSHISSEQLELYNKYKEINFAPT